MIKTPLTALALSALFALPALARDPAPAALEVLQGWELPDGRRVAALKITLDEGWHTYWRVPGDTGIPPEFTWSGARNLGDVQITWPQPKVFRDDGSRSIGYKGAVVIPLHVTPKRDGKPVRLKGKMDIGVCSDICMPYVLKFDEVLAPVGNQPVPAIAASLASAPYSAKEGGVRSATCRITPTQDGMQIEARVKMPSAGGREEAVIETSQPAIWVSEPVTTRKGGTIVAVSQMYHAQSPAFSINRSDVRITILGAGHSVDIRGCTAG